KLPSRPTTSRCPKLSRKRAVAGTGKGPCICGCTAPFACPPALPGAKRPAGSVPTPAGRSGSWSSVFAPERRSGLLARAAEPRSARLDDLPGREAGRADTDALARSILGNDASGLQVRKPATPGLVVGVADIVAGAGAFPANR